MPFLQGKDLEYVRGEFEKLPRRVTAVLFVGEGGSGGVFKDLMEEVGAIAPGKFSVRYGTPEEAEEKGIDLFPSFSLEADGEEYGVYFFGAPLGYEFASFLEAVRDVAEGEVELGESIRDELSGLSSPLVISVFVTPTCPYCPLAVRTAHRFAVASPKIRGEMIMASDFPELAKRYEVMAVPTVVINEVVRFEGAIPEEEFAAMVAEAATIQP